MKYDFETMLNRFDVGSTKWEEMRSYGITPEMNIMPMSNAEMEFYNLPEVQQGLCEYINNTVLAYFKPKQSYFDAFINWNKDRNGWKIEQDWIVPYPGVDGILCCTLGSFANDGDGIILLTPTWPGFFHVIEAHGCHRVDSGLIHRNNTYYINFEDLERKAAQPENRFLFFCSPGNPVGRVWTEEELRRVAEICLKHDVMIISDEIHSDLIMPGYKHIPMASLSEEVAQHTITCMAPSKTFNLAGLFCSNAIIPNAQWRDAFNKTRVKYGIFRPNMLAMKACELAYEKGGPWLDACLKKLDENRKLVETFIREKLPMLQVTKMEATYLMWVDMRGLGLSTEELERALMNDAHVFFDDGYYFGDEGAGFERVNIACPTEAVETALERLYAWIGKLKQANPAFDIASA